MKKAKAYFQVFIPHEEKKAKKKKLFKVMNIYPPKKTSISNISYLKGINLNSLDNLQQEFYNHQVGVYSKRERMLKILKYKRNRYRFFLPNTKRKFVNKSLIAKKKKRIKGRFIKSTQHQQLNKNKKTNSNININNNPMNDFPFLPIDNCSSFPSNGIMSLEDYNSDCESIELEL